MRISITGVPGTGKTTITNLAAKALGLKPIHLTDLAEEKDCYTGYDEERNCKIVDVEKVKKQVKNEDDVVFESHFAEEIPADKIIVLRLDPEEVMERLMNRRYSKKKAMENALAEALDYYTPQDKEKVYEINTTGLTPYDIVYKVVQAVKKGEDDEIDFSDWIRKNLKDIEKRGL